MFLKSLFVVAASTLLLAGCNETEEKANVSQVVMKVNGEEVTVHQYNQLLQNSRGKVNPNVDQDVLKQKVANALLEQVLVIQAAKEAGFERMPEVLSAIELAKNKAIADMYLKKTLQGVSNISDADAQAYYDKNPLLFKERKLFVYDNYVVPLKKEDISSFADKVKGLETINQIKGFLESEGVEYKFTQNLKMSEQLPKPLLKPMNIIKAQDIGFLKMSDGVLIIGLNEVKKQPVTFESVRDGIKRQLAGQKVKEATLRLVDSLKNKASVEYIGEFKKIAQPDAK